MRSSRIEDAADRFQALGNGRLAYVGLSVVGDHAQIRTVRLPALHADDLLIPRRDQEAIVSLVVSCGRATFITGSSRLAVFRERHRDLATYVRAHLSSVSNRRAHQERLLGTLEHSFACFDGAWVDLMPEGEDGYCVIGCDTERSRIYAIRRTPDGVSRQLYYAPLCVVGRPLDWHYVDSLPEQSTFVDASRFAGVLKGDSLTMIMRMRGSNGQLQNRLLTLDDEAADPRVRWSDPFTGSLQVLRRHRERVSAEDEPPRQQLGLLVLEDRQPDQYLLRQVPLQQCSALPLYAYAVGSR
jgi:hypothetical protein